MSNATDLLSQRLAAANAAGRPESCSEAEWALRVELAAAYRMIDHYG